MFGATHMYKSPYQMRDERTCLYNITTDVLKESNGFPKKGVGINGACVGGRKVMGFF